MNVTRVLDIAQQIANRYAAYDAVHAVALSGSYAAGNTDAKSDIDLYVYWRWEEPLSVELRRVVATTDADASEVDNRYWEAGDEWIDQQSGIKIDVTFRDIGWVVDELRRRIDRHEPSLGYSTAIWNNVLTAQPLFDRHGWPAECQSYAQQPYPEALRQAIVVKNRAVLRGIHSAYVTQLERASERRDVVAVNDRLAQFLISYFDIIFALNRVLHPGEKRQLYVAERQCQHLPQNMRANIETLLSDLRAPDLISRLHTLVDRLDEVLQQQGFVI